MTDARVVSWLCALALPLMLAGVRAGPPEQAWIKPKADQSLLLDVTCNGDRWVVVGERGHVLVSDDAESWRQVKAPTRVLLTAVEVDEQGLGFAVGHDATIIRTRDNGDTWERVYHAPDAQAPFLDLVMINHERVVAVGAYGLYVESNDAGGTWSRRILDPEELAEIAADEGDGGQELYYDFHLNDIAIAGDGRWYIAAEAGTVYRSDDEGKTWRRLPSPYAGSFFGVLPMQENRVLLFGLQGRLFVSNNAGESWRRIDTGTNATLVSGLRLANGQALVVGHAGVVLSGIGARGSLTRTRLPNRPALSGAYRSENGDLLTVGERGIRRWPAEVLSRFRDPVMQKRLEQ